MAEQASGGPSGSRPMETFPEMRNCMLHGHIEVYFTSRLNNSLDSVMSLGIVFGCVSSLWQVAPMIVRTGVRTPESRKLRQTLITLVVSHFATIKSSVLSESYMYPVRMISG
jgi:hypothetical protein